MGDSHVHGMIEQLVQEEHWQREANGTATDGDRQRLDALKVSLDQCWDMLRQRRRCTRRGWIRTRRRPVARGGRALRAVIARRGT
jgi:hypothetical protein